MKCATWNINSIRPRIHQVVDWLKIHQPDVLLLQEIKCMHQTFPFEPIEDLGYNIAIHGQKSYNGVAILSKTPLEDVKTTFPCSIQIESIQGDQARFIEAFTQGWRIISLYIPNGSEMTSDKFQYKLQFLSAITAYLKQVLTYDEKLIIGGDYNIAPYIEDGYNPQAFEAGDRILCTLPERQAFYQLLELGLYDAIQLKFGIEPRPFTWWDYRSGSFEANKGYRIDHLLTSAQAADCLVDAGVDCHPRSLDKPSDHAPVWAQFN